MTHVKKVIDGIENKYCYVCKKYKPISEFYKNVHNNDGLSDECKPCRTKTQRKYLHDYYLKNRATLLPKHRITALESIHKKRKKVEQDG